jgi:3-oxoacyl-[acyl-carrier-protein] synthase II
MQPIYIQGTGNISPQPTWDTDTLQNTIEHNSNRLVCNEPDYTTIMEAKQLRRMSRVMKMGAAAALLALKKSGASNADSIIAGTGLGCLEDTGIFLGRMLANREEALNPTPFIQSTHNTVGSHIAFLLQCQAYNQTYTHGPFSFEHAVQDAMLLLSESPDKNILVGGADEITDASHLIQSRFGLFKKGAINNLEIFKTGGKGTLHGEGSSWFVVSGRRANSNAKVLGVKTFYRPKEAMHKRINDFLLGCGSSSDNVDVVLSGKSGDCKSDVAFDEAMAQVFEKDIIGVYKHLCGEYPTSTSFAMWLAHSILKSGQVPSTVLAKGSGRVINTVLIYNTFFEDHHSMILLQRE